MKRKISLLMAFMMAATLVPAQPSHAVTTNNVNRVVSTTYNDGREIGGTILSWKNVKLVTGASTNFVGNTADSIAFAKRVAEEKLNNAKRDLDAKEATYNNEKAALDTKLNDYDAKVTALGTAKKALEKELKDLEPLVKEVENMHSEVARLAAEEKALQTPLVTTLTEAENEKANNFKSAADSTLTDIQRYIESGLATDLTTATNRIQTAKTASDSIDVATNVTAADTSVKAKAKMKELEDKVKDLNTKLQALNSNPGGVLYKYTEALKGVKAVDTAAYDAAKKAYEDAKEVHNAAKAEYNKAMALVPGKVEDNLQYGNLVGRIVPDVNIRLSSEDKTKESLKNTETFELHLEGGAEWAFSHDYTYLDSLGFVVGQAYPESELPQQYKNLHQISGTNNYSLSATDTEVLITKDEYGNWTPVRRAYRVRRQTSNILEVNMLVDLDNSTGASYVKSGIVVPIYANLGSADNGAQKVKVVDKGTRATAGTYTYANVADDDIKMRVARKEKISRSGENLVELMLDEVTKGAFNGRDTIELRLPAGFTWANQSNKVGNKTYATEIANGEIIGYSDDERTIVIRPFELGKEGNNPDKLDTIYLKAKIVVDRNAPLGDVDVVVVKGNVTPSSLVIAENVLDLVSVKAKKVLDVIAGKDEYGKYKSTIEIEENVANSLLDGKFMEFRLGTMQDGKFVEGDVSVQDGEQMKLKRMAGAATLEIDRDSSDFFAASTRFVREANIVTSGKERGEGTVDGFSWDFRVQNSSKDNTKSKYELTLPFVVDSGVEGDIVLNVKGAGVGDGKDKEVNVVIAKAKAPVTFEVANPLPQVKVGLQHQVASDITIKETEAAALQDYVPTGAYATLGWTSVVRKPIQESKQNTDTESGLNRSNDYVQVDNGTGTHVRVAPNEYVAKADLVHNITNDVWVYNGVSYTKSDFKFVKREGNYSRYTRKEKASTFADYYLRMDRKFNMNFTKVADIKVVDGDLRLNDKESGKAESNKSIEVAVDRRSTKASTIKVSGVEVTLDRTVPYGEVKLKGDFGIVSARHDLGDTVKKFDYFTTVTPVANDKRITTVFTIDQKGYSEVSGKDREDKTMEVAPFIQDNRTMLPLRYVANAIGATVNYDAKTRVATFEKDKVVVSINIDKDVMYVNGSPVKLFTKPANKEGRIFLPVANIAQAFGLKQNEPGADLKNVNMIWNAEARTVTILPQDATKDEINKALEGKVLEGTVTKAETPAEAKPEEKKAEETKPEEKKPEVKPEEKPAEKPAV